MIRKSTTNNLYRYLLACIVVILALPALSQAATLTELEQQQKKAAEDAVKYRSLQEQQQKAAATYEEQIERTEKTIQTVQSSLQVTSTKINQKEQDISVAAKDIDAKSQRLAELNGDQNKAIVDLYEMQIGSGSTEVMLVGNRSLSEVIDQSEYTQSVLDYVKHITDEVAHAKSDLEQKKSTLEGQRNELASLRSQQQAQKIGLESEKRQKDYLLTEATKKEQTYEQLAEAAERRKQEFDQQIAEILRSRRSGVVVKGTVRSGDVVGYMGSTGYSTGPHLHFSVLQSGNYVNPRSLVGSALRWPFNSFYVSQEFGRPSWAAKYSWHNGIDMIDDAGYGAPVRAACSGQTIEPFPQYNGWMPGGYGNYVVIDCGNGIWTLYGHMIK